MHIYIMEITQRFLLIKGHTTKISEKIIVQDDTATKPMQKYYK